MQRKGDYTKKEIEEKFRLLGLSSDKKRDYFRKMADIKIQDRLILISTLNTKKSEIKHGKLE